MAARQLTDEILKKALEMHCVATGKQFSEGEDHGVKRFLIIPGDVIVRQEAGKLICEDEAAKKALAEIIMDMPIEKPAKGPTCQACPPVGCKVPTNSRSSSLATRDVQVADLTLDDIKEYLCPKATDQEAFMFLKLCQARGMNPFLREAYLIKYSDQKPADMVVGKEHFTRTAEKNAQFDGFEAGIIVRHEGGIEKREGSFVDEGETLVGGWAKVWRKDRKTPFYNEVSLKDFQKIPPSGKPTPWTTIPAVMIRKVPLVQSLREAFANDLGGCYDQAEMGQAIIADYEVEAA